MDQQSFLIPQNTQQMTPDQRRQALAQHLQQQIMGQSAQNPMQGAAQMFAGVGMGMQQQSSAHPATPGGASPSFSTRMGNLFSFGNNGGLF